MNEELTPWFPKTVKPARKGVYQIKRTTGLCRGWTLYAYFDGKVFGWYLPSKEDAIDHYMRGDRHAKTFPWRGLANNPNKKASK